ncbi:YitT family protein [Acidaminobacter sp. JC074]|uniref:YczE/YyaS/YitT family protein n=1 Tax=Acidaminobacter sp. JC074 TaxID=2530199 RepID=UPI001F0DAB88|nr:YitT family protein [Acidaminobacter sp. JC074]
MKSLKRRILETMLAMLITSTGIVMMMKAELGLNPWWTLTTGVSELTGLSLGLVVQCAGFLLIIVALFLGVKPGITTVLDMFLIGLYIDILNKIVPSLPNNLILQLLACIMGVIVFSLGVSLTVSIGLGAGPKDSFTFAVMKKTHTSVGKMKLVVESSTFIIGLLLGGPFGIGTIVATVLTGHMQSYFYKKLNYNPEAII